MSITNGKQWIWYLRRRSLHEITQGRRVRARNVRRRRYISNITRISHYCRKKIQSKINARIQTRILRNLTRASRSRTHRYKCPNDQSSCVKAICVCDMDWEGDHCDQKKPPCNQRICLHDQMFDAESCGCDCKKPWAGDLCEKCAEKDCRVR